MNTVVSFGICRECELFVHIYYRPDATYELAQACQRWEKGGRSFSLPVDAIEDKDKVVWVLQHTLQMRDQRTDVFTSSCVCFHLSIDSISLQALVDCRRRPLKQVSPRHAFFAVHYNVPPAKGLEI